MSPNYKLSSMAFKFENLKVWQIAFELSNKIHFIALEFPKVEHFNLTSQLKRASDSVVLNIVEGSTSQSNPEFKRFLNFAYRSCLEVVSCILLAKARNYISEETKIEYYNKYEV